MPKNKKGGARHERRLIAAIRRRVAKAKAKRVAGRPLTKEQHRLLARHG